MQSPLLPAVREHFDIKATKIGIISSAYPLGALLAGFVFPALSDLVGRKPVLVASYLGVGLGFCLQALSLQMRWSYTLYVVTRVVTGTFSGASTVVKAYIADTADRKMMPRYMAWREAAGTLAYIIGPAFSATIFSFTDLPTAVLVSGFMSITAAGLIAALIRGSPTDDSSPMEPTQLAVQVVDDVRGVELAPPLLDAEGGMKPQPCGGASPAMRCPPPTPTAQVPAWGTIAGIITVSFAYNIGQSFFDGFFGLYTDETFGWTPRMLGPVLTAVACVVLFNSAVLYGALAERFGLLRVAVIGLACIGAGLALLSVAKRPIVFVALALYSFGVPMFAPGTPAILSSLADRRRRGFVLGLDSAMNSIGRIIAPIALGALYERGPSTAFRVAALVTFVGAGLLLAQKRRLSRIVR